MITGRYERKYAVDGNPERLRLKFLAAATALGYRTDTEAPDGTYELCSLYFDTPELGSLYANADGDYDHVKFRIRRYAGSDQLFYEIKCKRGDLIFKVRRALPGHTIEPELSRREFRDLLLASNMSALVSAGPLADVGRLNPAALVRYRRTALVDGPGERVCLDQRLAFGPPSVDQRHWFAPVLAAADPQLAVVELKCHPAAVHRRILALGQFASRPIGRFSKYCEAATWLHSDPASYGANPYLTLPALPHTPAYLRPGQRLAYPDNLE